MAHQFRWAAMIGLLSAVIMPIAAVAQEGGQATGFPGDVGDRLQLRLGFLYTGLTTTFAFNPEGTGLGLLLNLESAGLDRSVPTFDLDGSWRIGRRSWLVFGYNSVSRSGSKVLEERIEFNDYVFEVGTRVDSEFDSTNAALGYRYDLYDNGEVRLAGTAGFAWIDLWAHLRASGSVIDPSGNTLSGEYDKGFDVSVPAPQLGAIVEWAFARRGLVKMYWRSLLVELSGVRGTISSGGVAAAYYPLRNLGFGLGIEDTSITIREYRGDDYVARGNYDQLAGVAFLALAF